MDLFGELAGMSFTPDGDRLFVAVSGAPQLLFNSHAAAVVCISSGSAAAACIVAIRGIVLGGQGTPLLSALCRGPCLPRVPPHPTPLPADVHYSSVLQFDRHHARRTWADLL